MAKIKKNRDNLFGWLDFGTGIAGVAANVLSTILTNKKNREIAREQNSLQVRESEKAYERGKPINQVAQMQAAGMSKAGALNAINGGATYQPAPMTSAQAQVPQIDLSTAFDGLMQIGENAKQRKLQEDLQAKQIKAAENAQKAQFEENAKQREHDLLVKDIDTANQTQHDYLEYEKHKDNYNLALKRYNLDKDISDQLTPRQARVLDATVRKVSADADLTRTQENDLAYRIAEYQSKEYKTVRDAKNLLEGLQADFDYKITNKSFSDYLNENYDYDEKTGEYIPKQWHSNANKVQQGARTIWNTIFELIPVNLLLEALGGTVDNVRAIKLLSKVK